MTKRTITPSELLEQYGCHVEPFTFDTSTPTAKERALAEESYAHLPGAGNAQAEQDAMMAAADRNVRQAIAYAKSCKGPQLLHDVTASTLQAFGASDTSPVSQPEKPNPAKRPMPPSTVQEVDIDYSHADLRNMAILYGIPACLGCSVLTLAVIQFMSK